MTEVAVKLEPDTLRLFLYIAGEARHWDGMPPIEGLMPLSPEDKGRLTQLKRQVLLYVEEVDPHNHQIHFTRIGAALAAQHGVMIR
ncbi:hypothetical protein ACVWZ4_002862 [Bradyrhizobium sp. USDA 4472]